MTEASNSTIVAVIIGMAIANFALRFVPLALLSRVSFPVPLRRWLSFVPISVMGALVAVEVVGTEGISSELLTTAPLYASILTMVVFRFTRSFLGATMAGMLSFVVLSALIA